MSKKLKILISCYACSPYRGSEPGMGWSFVNGLSKFYEVHVITEQKKWEKPIKKYLEEYKNENLHFYYIRKKRMKLLRKIWPPSYYWFYKSWQKKAFQLASDLELKENFDIIHQLNMVGYREPGYLWKINKPFVWGPIGGTENVSWKLFPFFNLYGKVFYGFRNILNSLERSLASRPKMAAQRKNATIIAATSEIKNTISTLWKVNSQIIPEVGTLLIGKINPNQRKENEPLKIVWSGQHTSGKALPILLNSVSLLNVNINYKIDVLGVGKETKNWKNIATKLNVNQNCNWHGWLERTEAINVMKNAHVLCITSLKDLTSTVTLEGLSLGLPIICLNHCGFSFVVNESCGIKIDISNPEQIYNDFKNSIKYLFENEPERFNLANGAIKRAKDFSWDSKINQLNNIYKKLI
ncbi:glycosyltransferase family 4 protein [uncultured Polaribacter sp.]|uniref:glycosyltransferase family 4 protein n=1 Tax=uncultured Polaribacter sp. TaxID=174711 RepID=UPI002609E9EE|nr:glycosyltransferase [uncultured Polaribacter sp.]